MIVANHVMFIEQIIEYHFAPGLVQVGQIDLNRLGAFGAVAARNFRRHGLAIGHDVIHEFFRSVLLNCAHVIGQRVAGGFARLGHQICDVNAGRFSAGDRSGYFGNQQIGEARWCTANQGRAELNQLGELLRSRKAAGGRAWE